MSAQTIPRGATGTVALWDVHLRELLQAAGPRMVWLVVLLLVLASISPLAEVETAILKVRWIAPLLRQVFRNVLPVSSLIGCRAEMSPILRRGTIAQGTSITDMVCARLC